MQSASRTLSATFAQPAGRQLLGGYRLTQEFARGTIAADFARGRLWMAGHAQRNEVLEYSLPALGGGTDPAGWPKLMAVRTLAGWWQGGYCNGLCFWRGKLWASPRNGYDTAPPPTLTLYAQDGETAVVPLPRQAYSGFVKRGPDLDPLVGCGGYESGQGSVSGPTLARLDGTRLIGYGWPAAPGAGLEHWNERAPRDPDYWPENHVDSWLAWEPRTVGGTLQGRWACDKINGGGLVLPEGVAYWPLLGTGDIVYSRQSLTFGAALKSCRYLYDPATYALMGWEAFAPGEVGGQELDAQGRAWLCVKNVWKSGTYKTDAALFVYG